MKTTLSPVNLVMSKQYIRPLGTFFGWSGALKVEELGCPLATLKSTGWSLCRIEKIDPRTESYGRLQVIHLELKDS